MDANRASSVSPNQNNDSLQGIKIGTILASITDSKPLQPAVSGARASAQGQSPFLKGNLKHTSAQDEFALSIDQPKPKPKRISFDVSQLRQMEDEDSDEATSPKAYSTGTGTGIKKKKKKFYSNTRVRPFSLTGSTMRVMSAMSPEEIVESRSSGSTKYGSSFSAPTTASLLKAKPAFVKSKKSSGTSPKGNSKAKARAVTTSFAKSTEAVTANTVRFKSAPTELITVDGIRKRISSSKKVVHEPVHGSLTTPAPTANSIELTPGLAETLIPKNLDPPKFKPPPQPNFKVCSAFPGTPEWDSYWIDFNGAMKKYSKDMGEYNEGMAAFSEDLSRYKKAASVVTFEQQILKSKDGHILGLELGIVPPLLSYKLEGLHVLNGYIVKGKGFQGTLSSVPGQPNGIRVEVNTRGIDPDTILTQKEFNILTMSASASQFMRIGCPDGVVASDIEVWPMIDGVIILDGP